MRRWAFVVTAMVLVPLLAGCGSVVATIALGPDEMVDYEIRIESVAQIQVDDYGATTGWFYEDLCGSFTSGSNEFLGRSELVPIHGDGVSGCLVSGRQSIDELVAGDLGASGLDITHQDGVFGFRWALPGESSEEAELGDFALTVAFPGEVLKHNGSSTVSGTTVTWRNPGELFSAEGLVASGRDSAAIWSLVAGWAPYVAGASGVLAVAVLTIRRRSRRVAVSPQLDLDAAAAQRSTPDPSADQKVWAVPAEAERWQPTPPEAWAPQPSDLAEPLSGADSATWIGARPRPQDEKASSPSPWAPRPAEESKREY